jgi:hypothetical protein
MAGFRQFYKARIRKYLETRDPAILPSALVFEATHQGHKHWYDISYRGVEPTEADIRYLQDLLTAKEIPKGKPNDSE